MVRRMLPVMIALAGVAAVCSLAPDPAQQAQAATRHRTSPDLFYNYYVPPVGGGVGAELYLSPRPTPPVVGHTYVTYQPLMPHEFLYQHHRKYWRKNPDGGWTRTVVTWQQTFFDFNRFLRPPKPVYPLPRLRKWEPGF